jgi:ABC-type transport system involved in multi-copper enzyme maturation permease subunit
MMWLAWRQHRSEVVVIGGVLAILAVMLFISHEVMAAIVRQLGIATCFAHPNSTTSRCGLPFTAFLGQFSWQQLAITTLNLLPALLGMFVGAPLVARELEANTHRMIWMQGVSRLHWLMVKLALVMAVCLVAAVLLAVLVSWWRAPGPPRP